MGEALVLFDDDDEGPQPATREVVRAHIREALAQLTHVVQTGVRDADEDILGAEQLMRSALGKLND